MTTRADYSAEEWQMIQAAPLACSDCMMYSDMHVTDAMQEQAVVEQLVARWRKPDASDNPLVQAVMAEINIAAPRKSGSQAPQAILDDLAQVVAVVERKAPADEAHGFKQFLFAWAETVAHASGEEFLGEGKKLSDKEAQTLQQLKGVLGL